MKKKTEKTIELITTIIGCAALLFTLWVMTSCKTVEPCGGNRMVGEGENYNAQHVLP